MSVDTHRKPTGLCSPRSDTGQHPLFLLVRTFDYPDILRQPSSDPGQVRCRRRRACRAVAGVRLGRLRF
jgi:hypothetical protein